MGVPKSSKTYEEVYIMSENKNEIPEYNKIDSENDTIPVIEAKIEAIRKQREENKEEKGDK